MTFRKRDKTILLVLKEMANNAKHYLAKDLQKFTSGVEAFDFLIELMDPMSVDPTNENADAFEKFQKLELSSITSGSFSKFYSLFEYQLSEMTGADTIQFTTEYTKSLLISKLKHASYAPMKLPSATRNSYDTYVKELRQFAVVIEKDGKTYKSALMSKSNAVSGNQSGDGKTKRNIDKIEGYPIDERGNMPKDKYLALSEDDKQKFLDARKQMRSEGNITFKRHSSLGSKPNGGGGFKKKSEDRYKSMQKKINALNQDLKDARADKSSKEDSKSGEDDSKTKVINSINSTGMDKAAKEKAIAYIEKHISNVKMSRERDVYFNGDLRRRVNLMESLDDKQHTIVDGGADTGLNGSAYIFMEHTLRKANVTGYDSAMVTKGLPIGTSVTAAEDSNGDTVILLQNEQIDYTSQSNSMLAPNQLRHFGIDIDDCPSCYDVEGRRGRQSIKLEDVEIPFTYSRGLILLATRKPTEQELSECPVIMLTSDAEWNPEELNDNPKQHPVVETWDPDANANDRTIVNASVRSIMARRIKEGDRVHSRSSAAKANFLNDFLTEDEDTLMLEPSIPAIKFVQRTSTAAAIEDQLQGGDCDNSLSGREDGPIGTDKLHYVRNVCHGPENGSITSEDDSIETLNGWTDRPNGTDKLHYVDNENESVISDVLAVDEMEESSISSDDISMDSGGISEYNPNSLSNSPCGNPLTRHVLMNLSMESMHKDAQNGMKVYETASASDILKYVENVRRIQSSNRLINPTKSRKVDHDWESIRKKLAWLPTNIIKKTFEITTQLAKMDIRLPLRRHYKSRYPQAQVKRLNETFSTDTFFASQTGIKGQTMVQLFCGNTSGLVAPYGMCRESEGPTKLVEFVHDWGAPDRIHRDNSKMQNSEAWKKIESKYGIKRSMSEPHNQQQNPAERKIQTVKNGVNRLMDRTSTPKFMWYECLEFFCNILNVAASPSLDYKNPIQVAMGHSVDISPYLAYEWWEQVYYLDYEDPSFPNSKEKMGRYCGPVDNCGDIMTFKIYVPETHQIIYRSVTRSAKEDRGEPNHRAANPNYPDDDATYEELVDTSHVDEIKGTGENADDSDIPIDYEGPDSTGSSNLISLAELLEKVGHKDSKYGTLPNPQDIIGFTFPEEHEGVTQRAKVVEMPEGEDYATYELGDGSRHLIEYHLLIEKFNAPEADGNEIFTFSGILDHRAKKGVWEVLVQWDGIGYEPTWEPLKNIRAADPITLSEYAREKKLLQTKGWKWAKKYRINSKKMIRLARRIFQAKRTDVKYQFGVRVPRTVEEAYRLDKENGNTLWRDAIRKEIQQLLDYQTFRILMLGERAPDDHQKVPLIMAFAVKHDGRRKARCCAGGHVTDPGNAEVYSSVVAPEGVRIVVLMGDHNGMDSMSGDVGNAYLYGVTREKIFVVLGIEFGPKLAGRIAIVVKALYGLKTSSARWSEHLSDTLRSMGWFQSKAENDVWMKDCGDRYEYLAVYSDDIIVTAKDPKAVLEQIRKVYILKGVGVPDYFLGAEYGRQKGDYNERGETSTWSARTYLKNVIEKIERILGPLRSYTCPMDPEYHPELDDTDMLQPEGISQYRMLTGSAQWAITLGRLDIIYSTAMLSRYNCAPREGHMLAMKKVFGYLKSHIKGKLVFNTKPMDISRAKFVDCVEWKQVYGSDMKEDVPHDMPEPKMKPLDINVYFDASHGCDMLTRRSCTGIILFLNNTPVKWFCKKQNTVESSTYGAELVAGRLAAEMIIEFRYKMRMLGVPVEGPSIMLGDNMSVIQNCSIPSSQLKKKHNAIAYHRVRECVASNIIKLGHVSSESNYADLCTKALNGPKLHGLMKDLLF